MTSEGRLWRTRLAVGLVSLAVITLELALMRALSLRFWHHFACMVVGVALLGFGASGTLIGLLRKRIEGRWSRWIPASAFAFSLSVPVAYAVGDRVPLNVHFLAWSSSQIVNVAVIELVMFVPFCLAAFMIGLVLSRDAVDRPDLLPGHYAANLIGSGAGAVASVLLMYVLGTRGLVLTVSAAAYASGVLVLPAPALRGARGAVMAAAAGAALAAMALLVPAEPAVSQYKMLSFVRSMPGTELVCRAEGPLGRIDVVSGPAVHHAPGLSLAYTGRVPPHVLLIADGDQTSAVYDCDAREDWAFMDHTVSAVAYHVRPGANVLVVGAGGGADIGLALFHGCPEVVALEMNPQVIEFMTGPLAARGGSVYRARGVTVVNGEARGYLASARAARRRGAFDVIQLPAMDAFGASGAGLYAAQESYLYTVESFESMLDRLADDGVLCVTRWARTPPRDGLRVFDTAREALRRKGLEPSGRLAMIRSWATAAVLVSKRPFSREDARAVRAFSAERSFDVCWLPGLAEGEANRFHVLARPYYHEGAKALLGPDRDAYLESYPFEISAATDDRPYFHHFFRMRAMSSLRDQIGARSRAFLELGYLMLLASLVQAVLLAAVMIVVPLAPGMRAVSLTSGSAAALGYFSVLGLGFMLLEMGFLQRLVLYLAHPTYSAAAAISSFLVFGGLGSALCRLWRWRPERTAVLAAGAAVCLSVVYLLLLDRWLALTQAAPVPVRFLVASITIAPLAFAMGHMFPLGLARIGASEPALVPWAWASNGFASVVATVAAPLLAMRIGFSLLTLLAAACYAAAALLFRLLPARTASAAELSGV